MRAALDEGLQELEDQVREQARLVRRSLAATGEVMRSCDLDLVARIIDDDDAIDDAYVVLHRGVEALLARQTPVAVDLRSALAILSINGSLERIGDYCVTIAKLTKLVCEIPPDEQLVDEFVHMAQHADMMVEHAIASFIRRDDVAAAQLVEMDEVINESNRRAMRSILNHGADELRQEWGLRMILVSRCLERIGDHAVDIGEQTAFLVTGEFREFTDASGGS